MWSTPELVDAILEENFKLRQQVQNHQHNIAKLQKVRHFTDGISERIRRFAQKEFKLQRISLFFII